MVTKWWNDLWLWSNQTYYREFSNNLHCIESIQKQILQNYIHINKNTLFGKNHQFSQIHCYEDYQKYVPLIQDYEDIRPYIEKIKKGGSDILTTDTVLFFETTSGSTSNPKFIPYTQTLKNEFQKGIAVWMHELRRQYPEALAGKSYWSLSPPLKERTKTSSGIPVGTTSDDEYFNPMTRWMLKQIMAVDNSVLEHTDPFQFYLHACRQLLASENLSFISVWNPSFFLLLDTFMHNHFEEIVSGLKQKRRQTALLKINTFSWSEIFPHLKVISCWTDAQASLWLPSLRAKTKNIIIQPKGLLSTEGLVTIPTTQGNALAFTSHFYEFINITSGKTYLAHQLQTNQRYEVVITTGGGLYRYKTKDIVSVQQVEPFPTLKFEGRAGVVSDLVGEKINQLAVQEIFTSLLDSNSEISGLLLQPCLSDTGANYQLYIFGENSIPVEKITMQVENQLRKNPYYSQAVDINQLAPLKAILLPPDKLKNIAAIYASQNQMKDGDAKLPVLLPLHFQIGL